MTLNDALNKPKTKAGIDYRIWLGCFLAGGLLAAKVSILGGISLIIGLPAAIRLVQRRDPQIYRLWQLAWRQRAYYDPGKVIR